MNSTKISGIENIQTDIVVIGGGASGLSAAVSALKAGAKDIIVLEKAKVLGGNGRMSVGFFAAESPAQKKSGINVSKDEMFKQLMAYNHWKSDARTVRVWVNKTSEIAAWLEGMGLETTLGETSFVFDREISGTWHMLYQGEGKSPDPIGKPIVKILTEECRKFGVQLLVNTSATQILTDKNQIVTGVMATTGGREFKIGAKSIIIGTGGFARNEKLLKKYFPLYNENMFISCLPQMTGDGLIMARGVGAAIDKSSIAFVFFGPNHYSWNNYLTYLHRMSEMIHVNKNGERYIGEYNGVSFDNSNALTRQPHSISYTVFDTKIKQEVIEKRRPFGPHVEDLTAREDWLEVIENAINKEVHNGRIKISDSWDEIANFIGAKPVTLKATIQEYNSFCDKGYDSDFLKDKQYLWPLRTSPYYAILSSQGLDVSVGGIKINHRMEVVNKRDSPISGLYAVGNDAGGIHAGNYAGGVGAPGCDLSFALCSGYIAGENATKYAIELKS
jgi:fumarate reductase flavoprotein subunit